MRNILFGLLFLIAINISVSAAGNGFYICKDTIASIDTLAVADSVSVDTLAVADSVSTDTLAVADSVSADTLAVSDTLPSVKSFFAARLDSIVAKYDTLKLEVADGNDL